VILWATVLLFFSFAASGQMVSDARLQRLLGSDPGASGAAKAELLQHPDPALLPALLQALPSSTKATRDNLLEVLAKYDDPRKIPVFIALVQSSPSGATSTLAIDDQLSHLGAPAAQALLAGCSVSSEDYPRWVAGVLSWMHETGAHFLADAVQSNDPCLHSAGEIGLLYMFGDADPNAVSRADIELASDALIEPDERISAAARQWFASVKAKEDNIDFSGIVEALIGAYQAGSPPETMVRIAEMLSQRERPRVTRFMRAAVHAPNPEIQQIANQYLSTYAPKSQPPRSGASTGPQSMR